MLASSLGQLLDYLLESTCDLLGQPLLCLVLLKSLKSGFLLSSYLKEDYIGFTKRLAKLAHETFRSMHSFNYRRIEHSHLASELQLLEDLKFLVLH